MACKGVNKGQRERERCQQRAERGRRPRARRKGSAGLLCSRREEPWPREDVEKCVHMKGWGRPWVCKQRCGKKSKGHGNGAPQGRARGPRGTQGGDPGALGFAAGRGVGWVCNTQLRGRSKEGGRDNAAGTVRTLGTNWARKRAGNVRRQRSGEEAAWRRVVRLLCVRRWCMCST